MSTPPKLSETQKRRLATLEPALRNAVRLGDYQTAKQVTLDIQDLLRPTGHVTRLMQAKNWLFEAAMEAGQIEIAVSGFEGIRQRVSPRTRIYLEATALLAICRIRQRDLSRAEPLMSEVLKNDTVITSEKRRRQFRVRVIARFEQEGVLAALSGRGDDRLLPDEIEKEAAEAVRTKTDDEIFADLGRALPAATVAFLLKVDQLARRQLAPEDLKYLPTSQDLIKQSELGRTTFQSAKRVLWRSLCDPKSDIYQTWFNSGLSAVLNKRFVSSCVIAALTGFGIAIKGLVVSFVALIIKFGIEVYCDRFKPEGVMIARDE